MAYAHKNKKGQTYYLHGKEVTLQNGRLQQIYYFAREEKRGDEYSSQCDCDSHDQSVFRLTAETRPSLPRSVSNETF